MAHLPASIPSQAPTAWSIVQPIVARSAGTGPAAYGGATTTTTTTTTTIGVPAAATTMSNRDRTGFDADDPMFKRLMLAILYSRNLIHSYYYLLFVGVALFVAINSFARLRQWHRTKRTGLTISSRDVRWIRTVHGIRRASHHRVGSKTHHKASSSSNGFVSALYDSSLGMLHEQSPLLNDGLVQNQHGAFSRIAIGLRSWLMSQPKRVLLGQMMPHNSVTLLLLAGLLANILYLLYNVNLSMEMLFVLADRAAILFAANLPVLYFLSAKNQPLQQVFGYSYASLNTFHRRLGEWMVFLACFHGGMMFVVWAVTLRPRDYDFVKFITDRVTYLGLCALVCFGSLFVTSLNKFRRTRYELFLVCHIGLQLGGLSFLYFHHSRSRPYVVSSLWIWSLDRLFCRWLARSRTFKASFETMPDERTIKVRMTVPLQASNIVWKILGLRSVKNGWNASDHAFLNMPALGGKYVFQSHPFSIATMAPVPGSKAAELGFLIRMRDGFTKDLLAYAQQHPSTLVNVDGPYGTRSSLRMLQGSQTRILVAGGSGIAVIWPLMHALMGHASSHEIDLEHARDSGALQPIHFIWVVHDAKQYYWIEKSQLAALRSTFGINVITPPPTGQAGRPNMGRILESCITALPASERVGVLCSGPDSMARDVRNGCAEMVKSGRHVQVGIEKYGW